MIAIIFYQTWTGFFWGALGFFLGTLFIHFWVGVALAVIAGGWDYATAEERLGKKRYDNYRKNIAGAVATLVGYAGDIEVLDFIVEYAPAEFSKKKIKREAVYLRGFTIMSYLEHKNYDMVSPFMLAWMDEIKRFRGYGCSLDGFRDARKTYTHGINRHLENVTTEDTDILGVVGKIFSQRVCNQKVQELAELGGDIFAQTYRDIS